MVGILFFRVKEVSKPIWLKSNMLRTRLEDSEFDELYLFNGGKEDDENDC